MDINELRKLMQEGVVEFEYIKKDGTIRKAHGTTKMDLISEDKHPVGTTKTLSDSVVRYFDVDKEEWRSFRVDSFVSNPEEINE